MSGRHGHSHAAAEVPTGRRMRWLLAAALAPFALATVGSGAVVAHHRAPAA